MTVNHILPWDDWTEDALLRELAQCDLNRDICDRAHKIMPHLDIETIKHSYLLLAGQKSGIRHYTFDALRFADAVRRSNMDFFLRHDDLDPFRVDRKLRQLDLFS